MPVTAGQGGGLLNMTLKAWAYVAADGTVIRSFNVASVTRETGFYNINFTTPMATTRHVSRVPAWTSASVVTPGAVAPTTGRTQLRFLQSDGSAIDTSFYVEVYE